MKKNHKNPQNQNESIAAVGKLALMLAAILTYNCFNFEAEEVGGGTFGGIEIPTPNPSSSSIYTQRKIGTQIWMTKNLDTEAPSSKCYNDDPANCTKYGKLYTWETAKTICPNGWHLPSVEEWIKLINYVDGTTIDTIHDSKTAGRHLKAKSGWNRSGVNDGNGQDTYGFKALPGGQGYSDGTFSEIGISGYWWLSSEKDNNAYYLYMKHHYDEAQWSFDGKSKEHIRSVRCLQDQD